MTTNSGNDLLIKRLRGGAFEPGVHFVTQALAWMAEAADVIEALQGEAPANDLPPGAFSIIVHPGDDQGLPPAGWEWDSVDGRVWAIRPSTETLPPKVMVPIDRTLALDIIHGNAFPSRLLSSAVEGALLSEAVALGFGREQ